jgi:transposase InsO family protein
VAPNVLNRQFKVEQVKDVTRAWAGDITFIPVQGGWLYLAVVLDLKSRRVIGWSLKDSLEQGLVGEALLMAQGARLQEPTGQTLLFHSDRGSQYAAGATRDWLRQWEIVQSMSRSGNCWDNAVVESFFATLKKELVHREHYQTPEQANASLFYYIEVFYNRQRRHSALGFQSPHDYEQMLLSNSPP